MNSALFPDVPPIVHSDGTLTVAVARPIHLLGHVGIITLALPARHPAERLAGRYLLARCGAQNTDERAEQWSIYLRRPTLPSRASATGKRHERYGALGGMHARLPGSGLHMAGRATGRGDSQPTRTVAATASISIQRHAACCSSPS